MKFSFNSKSDINQSLNIVIPNAEVEKDVAERLKKAQKDSKLKGFRKGKAPLDVVTNIYGPEIRQEVVYDLVTKSFYKQAEEKGLKIVSRPNLIPEKMDVGQDVKFKATFEIYPDISLGNLNRLTYTKSTCSINEEDLDKTVSNLQKRMSKWEDSDEHSCEGDQIKINFIGKIENEEFEGGSATDFQVEIGSKSMIEGFEEGLKELKKGDKKTLDLLFPDDYGKTELASKPVSFEVEVTSVSKPVLPELNEDFFKSTGVEAKNIEDYKKEVKIKLEEDLQNILKGKARQSIYDSLVEANEFEAPKTMIDSEILNMKSDAARRMGIDPKDLKEELFPNETFTEEAEKRVKIGILLNQVIEQNGLKPDPDKVKEIIEERAKNYKEPQQVINYFYADEQQLKNIESISLEEQVVELVEASAKAKEEELSYEECISGNNLA